MTFKIGDRIFVRGYIDEIRKDTVIVRNDGGYFGTILSEVTGELPSAQPAHWIPEYPNKRTGKAYSHTCSKCGKTVYDSRQVSIDEMGYYFCPCCGARME